MIFYYVSERGGHLQLVEVPNPNGDYDLSWCDYEDPITGCPVLNKKQAEDFLYAFKQGVEYAQTLDKRTSGHA